jgi:hypothetical protein
MYFGCATCYAECLTTLALEFEMCLLLTELTLHTSCCACGKTFPFSEVMDVRYTIVVDSDVKYPLETFRREVKHYLQDSNGWKSRGYTFQEVDTGYTCCIHLSSPAGILRAGCEDGSLSCAELNGMHLRLNAMRWTQGAPASKLPLKDYRQYMVTHEMGHILGFDHVKCSGPNQPAPLMMQQSLGIGKCKPNTKLTTSDTRPTR